MALIRTFGHKLTTIRNFIWPEYQPERYYMRGPGPACARRHPHG
jgi:hypothetical protein